MKKILVLLIATICITCAYGQSKKKIAILPVAGSVDEDIKGALLDALQEGASISGKYTLVERNTDFQQALKKINQTSGTFDDKQVLEFGRAVKADFVCYANIRKIGANYRISYNMLDVTSSGTPNVRSKSTTNGDNDLLAVLDDIAEDIFGGKAATEQVRREQARVEEQNQKNDLRKNLSKYCSGIKEVAPADRGPFTHGKTIDNLEKECPKGYKLPNETQLRCLIKHEICDEYKTYWTSEVREEKGRTQRVNPVHRHIVNNTSYKATYRNYVGASSGSFHYKTSYGNGPGTDYNNSTSSAYIRCIK